MSETYSTLLSCDINASCVKCLRVVSECSACNLSLWPRWRAWNMSKSPFVQCMRTVHKTDSHVCTGTMHGSLHQALWRCVAALGGRVVAVVKVVRVVVVEILVSV